ncbi:MAG TPA: LysE family transporter [Candidatus Limnocylindrales bacterium]|nr:LysE family transporter [Candidatus Limnocylindrales bacterium]
MLAAFIAGALAGYAIAIPVGAIAVLIVETGVRRGFRVGAAAGAGAATADLVYATLAMAGGTAIAPALAPWSVPLRVAAIAFLLYLGLRGLIRIARDRRAAATGGGPDGPAAASQPDGPGAIATYARFVGLTLLNPSTVVYFAALVLALPSLGADPLARPAFVVGAFLASISWQTVLAAVGAVAHHRLPASFQLGLSVLGNLMICGFAVALARSVLTG